MNKPEHTPIAALRTIAQQCALDPVVQSAWHAAENELFSLRAALATQTALYVQAKTIAHDLANNEHVRLLRNLLIDHDRLSGGKESVTTAAVRAILAGLQEQTV